MALQNLTIARGNVRQSTITIKNPDGTAFDLTGKRVVFTAKLDRNSSVFVFQKTSSSGITVASPATGIATMTFNTVDTSTLPIGTVLDCAIDVDDNPANPVTVYTGTLTIAWGTT